MTLKNAREARVGTPEGKERAREVQKVFRFPAKREYIIDAERVPHISAPFVVRYFLQLWIQLPEL